MQHKKESTIKRMLSTMTNDGPGDFLQKQKKNKKKEKEKEKEKRTQKPNQRRRSENASRREHEMRPSRNLIGPAAANYDGPLSLSLSDSRSTSINLYDCVRCNVMASLSLSLSLLEHEPFHGRPFTNALATKTNEETVEPIKFLCFVSFRFVSFDFFLGGGVSFQRPSEIKKI